MYSLAFQLVLHLICRYCLLGNANIVRHDTGIEILRWCETSVKTAHFAIKEKLKESFVIKKDGKKQITTGVRDLCVKIGNLADHGWFCCTVKGHGICFVCYTRFFVRKIGYINFVPKSVRRPSVRLSVRLSVRPSVTFLVIVSSPKPLDVAT